MEISHCIALAVKARQPKEGPEREQWLDRTWLMELPSRHERFLLHFPSLHSYSAQRLLQMFPLRTLLAGLDEDLSSCPVPVHALKVRLYIIV